MSFLDTEAGLSGSIYSQAHLEWARDYLVNLILREDSSWLKKPVGYLSRFWLADDLAAVCALIDFAHTLYRLETSLEPGSKQVFFRKVQSLLRKIARREAFEEALTELQVATLLGERAEKILLEPRILEIRPDARPHFAPLSGSKMLDLALLAGDELLFVEVTVIHSQVLNEWVKAANALAKLINLSLWLEEIPRQVRLVLPFPEFVEQRQPENLAKLILDKITAQPQGIDQFEIEVGEAGNKPIKVEWGEPELKIEEETVEEVAFRQGAVRYNLAGENFPALEEVVLKALRNSLQIKRQQFQLATSLALVIRPGNALLTPALLRRIIEKRLWTNPRFGWLGAIAIFTPRPGYHPNNAGPTLWFLANPKARFPVSAGLQAVFKPPVQT